MLFLGVDPGYGRMGYALIENYSAHKLRAVDWGILETQTDLPHAQRLLQLHVMLKNLLQPYCAKNKIVMGAVEEVFFRKNLTTGVKLLQARGVILCTLAECGIAVSEITPSELKKMITGSGSAKKDAVKIMVTRLLSLPTEKKNLPDDAYDALALAISAWMRHRSGGITK